MAKSQIFYRLFLFHIGRGTIIRNPILIEGAKYISLGRQVLIRDGARIEVIRSSLSRTPRLIIGDFVTIEQNFHLACAFDITIDDHVAIAAGCSIVDISHPFWDLSIVTNIGAYIDSMPARVHIGRRAFLGVGVTVLPNVVIGEYAMIGAHSVVTSDIPAFCVAIGSPARVIRSLKKKPLQPE